MATKPAPKVLALRPVNAASRAGMAATSVAIAASATLASLRPPLSTMVSVAIWLMMVGVLIRTAEGGRPSSEARAVALIVGAAKDTPYPSRRSIATAKAEARELSSRRAPSCASNLLPTSARADEGVAETSHAMAPPRSSPHVANDSAAVAWAASTSAPPASLRWADEFCKMLIWTEAAGEATRSAAARRASMTPDVFADPRPAEDGSMSIVTSVMNSRGG